MKPERIQKQLEAHPGWTSAITKQKLVRDFDLESFQEAVRFVNLVSRKAGKSQHDVEVIIQGTTVTLGLSSAAEGEVTEAQFALAGVIDEEAKQLETAA